nr:probable ATP-dependent RNA helicase DDX5 [Rhipicephalus microplus]
MLVLTLAREVALQVQTAVQELSRESGIHTVCILSGYSKPPQIKQLKKGIDNCTATPGHLKAFTIKDMVKVGHCTLLATDEVDCILLVGFGGSIKSITDNTRPDRQTLVKLAYAIRISRKS